MLQNFLVARARGQIAGAALYGYLRAELMAADDTKALLPQFVRTSRTLEMFWAYIRAQSSTYAGREAIIYEAFAPLLDYLEGRSRAPADTTISAILESFDAEGVHRAWTRALERRQSDPERVPSRPPARC